VPASSNQVVKFKKKETFFSAFCGTFGTIPGNNKNERKEKQVNKDIRMDI